MNWEVISQEREEDWNDPKGGEGVFIQLISSSIFALEIQLHLWLGFDNGGILHLRIKAIIIITTTTTAAAREGSVSSRPDWVIYIEIIFRARFVRGGEGERVIDRVIFQSPAPRAYRRRISSFQERYSISIYLRCLLSMQTELSNLEV